MDLTGAFAYLLDNDDLVWPLPHDPDHATTTSPRTERNPKLNWAMQELRRRRSALSTDMMMFVREERFLDVLQHGWVVLRRWCVGDLYGVLSFKGQSEGVAGGSHLYYQLEANTNTALFFDTDGCSDQLGVVAFRMYISMIIRETRNAFEESMGSVVASRVGFAVHLCSGPKRSAHIHVFEGPYMPSVKLWRVWVQAYVLPRLSMEARDVVDMCVYRAGLLRMPGSSKCVTNMNTAPRVLSLEPDPILSDEWVVDLFTRRRIVYEAYLHPHMVIPGSSVMDIPSQVAQGIAYPDRGAVPELCTFTHDDWSTHGQFLLDSISAIRAADMDVASVSTEATHLICIRVRNTRTARMCPLSSTYHQHNHSVFYVNPVTETCFRACHDEDCASGWLVWYMHRSTSTEFELFTEENTYTYDRAMVRVLEVENVPKYTMIAADCGAGKSHRIREVINNSAGVSISSVLFVTTRISFALSLVSEFPRCVLYSDSMGPITDRWVICQYESLHRLCGEAYDLVVLDEMRSLIVNTCCVLTNGRMLHCNHEKMTWMLRNAKHVIVADADLLNDDAVSGYFTLPGGACIRPSDVSLHVYTRACMRRTFVFLNDDLWWCRLKECVMSRVKVVICCGSASDAIGIPTVLGGMLPDDMIDSRRTVVITARGDDDTMNAIFRDFDGAMRVTDIMIYTSKVSVGLDIRIPVGKVFVLPRTRTVTPRETYQMVCRARALVDKEVLVATRGSGLIWCNTETVTIDDCERDMSTRASVMRSYHSLLSQEGAATGRDGRVCMRPTYLTHATMLHELERRASNARWAVEFGKLLIARGQRVVVRVPIVQPTPSAAPARLQKRSRDEVREQHAAWYDTMNYSEYVDTLSDRTVTRHTVHATEYDKFVLDVVHTNRRFAYEDLTMDPRASPPLSFNEYCSETHSYASLRVGLLYLTREAGEAFDWDRISSTCYLDDAPAHARVAYRFLDMCRQMNVALAAYTPEHAFFNTAWACRDTCLNAIPEQEFGQQMALANVKVQRRAGHTEIQRKMCMFRALTRAVLGGAVSTRRYKWEGYDQMHMCIKVPRTLVALALRRRFVVWTRVNASAQEATRADEEWLFPVTH